MNTERPAVETQEFFLVDEVAMMRFMSLCHQSCDPEMWASFEVLCRKLIDIRPGLRDGCFERIEGYLRGEKDPRWDSIGHPVLNA